MTNSVSALVLNESLTGRTISSYSILPATLVFTLVRHVSPQTLPAVTHGLMSIYECIHFVPQLWEGFKAPMKFTCTETMLTGTASLHEVNVNLKYLPFNSRQQLNL